MYADYKTDKYVRQKYVNQLINRYVNNDVSYQFIR